MDARLRPRGAQLTGALTSLLLLLAPADAAPRVSTPEAAGLDEGAVALVAVGGAARNLEDGYPADLDGALRLGLAAAPLPRLGANGSFDAHTQRWSVGARYRVLDGAFKLAPTIAVLGYGATTWPELFLSLSANWRPVDRLAFSLNVPVFRPRGLRSEHEPLARALVPYGALWIPMPLLGVDLALGDQSAVGLLIDGSATLGPGAELWLSRALSEQISVRGALWSGLEPLSDYNQLGLVSEVLWRAW